MRILIIIGYLYPVLGGTEWAGYNIARLLASRGHEVVVITRYSMGFRRGTIEHIAPLKSYEEAFDGRLRIFRMRSLPTMYGRALSDIFHAYRIGWRWRPDIILAFTLMPYAFSAIVVKHLFRLTHLKDIPVMGWGRGSDVMVTPRRGDVVGAISRILLPIVFQGDMILAQTPAMKEILIGYGCRPSKIRILGNGVDLESFQISDGGDGRTVLYVGSARPAKGLPYLVRAVNDLPQVRLIVLGGWGEEGDLCRSLAKENTEFVGKVPPSKVRDYLAKASIFCLPSLSEGFPNALLEAMAAGLPIVATRVGGIPYILGDSGILVPPRDTASLREALKCLLDDPGRRREYGRRALERAQHFSWDRVVDELEGMMKKILHRRGYSL
jgi:glycosyltransferase involved in cell wall biosynthesis